MCPRRPRFDLHKRWRDFEPVEGEPPIRPFYGPLDPDIPRQWDVY